MLDGETLDNPLTVAADFIDLKSPYMAGHSRRCVQLSADAAQLLGVAEDAVTTVRRAALVHDFGAPPQCQTPSRTSLARSLARSSTGSSFTPC
jgi:response regulator RpfG family c-di-GMP phosphodiesterase